jgi:DNA-binding transcriptional regulator YdaS (Cro superfamily)
MDIKSYLDKAERGEATRIAQHLRVHPVMVSQWANGAKPVPAERCPGIERATAAAVTCEELRPDVAWHRVPDDEWPGGKGRPLLDLARVAA